ncbi:MAG: DUF3341 domain-containing protein [Bacteroidota bacterium]|nr:DUF3341 domain-containing protein [Bacteroidota bacterium]
MKNKIIHAIFDDEQDVLSVVKDLRDNKIQVNEVYSPFPIHGLDPVLGLKETRMAITAFIYGCIGLTFGALLIYYIMISGVGKSWPINVGGKPNFTFYHNLPSFVPIMFECTVLFAGHLMSITYLFRNKLYPGATTTSPDPRTTDDKFLVELTYSNNKEEVLDLLKKSNVTEINEKDEV